MKKLLFILIYCIALFSCKKSNNIHTILKGTVSEKYGNLKIENYRITLVKSWRCCSNFMCGWCSEEIATTYTDNNGNYSLSFDYILKEGESFAIEKDYNTPYLSDDSGTPAIVQGKENIINMQVWKPVKIKLNLDIKNNNTPPLIVGLNLNNDYTFGTNKIYENDINKIIELWTRPNSNINIDFWYFEDNISYTSPRRLKTIPYTTNLDEIHEMSFEIDCSTF